MWIRFALLLALLSLVVAPATAQVKLQVTNLEPGGTLNISIFNQADGFPSDPQKAYQTKQVPVTATSLAVDLGSLPAGTYAIALHHDRNNNGKMDANFVGIPKEPYGASNNAKGRMGPPKFADAAFRVTPGTPTRQDVQMIR